ncbi:MAG: hypothetical protein DRQ37_03355 [Gammaproteobacteria bacterium]|nr:MAG: hypothetical protein DRQ37_03355 [Gammaproteobacteria bacterium]
MRHSFLAGLLLVASGLFLATSAHATGLDAGAFEARVQTVESLLAAYERIEKDGTRIGKPAWVGKTVRGKVSKAKGLQASGDLERASEVLGQAYLLIKVSIRGATAKRETAQVQETSAAPRDDSAAEREYAALGKTLEALLGAYARISSEQPEAADTGLLERIRRGIDEAKQFHAQGRIQAALDHMHTAYGELVSAIQRMRGGQTLVRTLKFDSLEDEYAYELQRYATHTKLVDILVSNRAPSDRLVGQVRTTRSQCEQMKQAAMVLAANGDHQQAVHSLEAASRLLFSLIRRAGVFIPG